MKRQIQTSAAAAFFDAAKKPATNRVPVPVLLPRSFGRSVGSIIAPLAANTHGVERRHAVIERLADREPPEFCLLTCENAFAARRLSAFGTLIRLFVRLLI